MKEIEKQTGKKFMRVVWAEARKSNCLKKGHGAVIVKGGKILAKGHNKVIGNCETCIRIERKIGSGNNLELCFGIHAEQSALLDALKKQKNISKAVIYVGRIELNGLPGSGILCCTICSRLIAASGLKGVVVHSEGKYCFYSVKEFNKQVYLNL